MAQGCAKDKTTQQTEQNHWEGAFTLEIIFYISLSWHPMTVTANQTPTCDKQNENDYSRN